MLHLFDASNYIVHVGKIPITYPTGKILPLPCALSSVDNHGLERRHPYDNGVAFADSSIHGVANALAVVRLKHGTAGISKAQLIRVWIGAKWC